MLSVCVWGGGGEGSKGDVTVAGTELGVTRWRCLPGW